MSMLKNFSFAVVIASLSFSCASTAKQKSSDKKPAQATGGGDVRINTDVSNSPAKTPNTGGNAPNESEDGDGVIPAAGGDDDGNTDIVVEDEPTQNAACYKADKKICDIEVEIGKIVNTERKKAGLGSLVFSSKASYVARLWSETQGKRGFIGHDGWPRQREQVFASEFNGELGTNAENVAMTGGSSAQSIAAEFMRMWMNSAGHRQNILGRSAGIGIGVAETGNGAWYGTQIFTSGTP